jgi:dTDP-4-amino-4,6-dideoxygalactose transaminase
MALPPIEFIDLKAQQRLIRARVDAAIARVLDHGQYIMGPEIFELERQLSHWTGAKHSLSCASGTDALLIAMMAKGLGPGDAVLCPAFTYTATPETIALLGASPVFVDVDGESFNLAPQQLKAGLDAAQNAGLTPRAIIAVDLFGRPADYVAIADFAKEHGLSVKLQQRVFSPPSRLVVTGMAGRFLQMMIRLPK